MSVVRRLDSPWVTAASVKRPQDPRGAANEAWRRSGLRRLTNHAHMRYMGSDERLSFPIVPALAHQSTRMLSILVPPERLLSDRAHPCRCGENLRRSAWTEMRLTTSLGL